jgi:hypothetical protein
MAIVTLRGTITQHGHPLATDDAKRRLIGPAPEKLKFHIAT